MLGLEPRTYPLSYYYSKRNIFNKITYEKVEVLRTLILFIFSVTRSQDTASMLVSVQVDTYANII